MEAEVSAYTGLSCATQKAWDRSGYSDYSNNRIKVTKYLLRFSLILKCCMEIFGLKEPSTLLILLFCFQNFIRFTSNFELDETNVLITFPSQLWLH